MKKFLRLTLRCLGVVALIVNIVAAIHAYKFTHFADASAVKTRKPEDLSLDDKLKALFLGVSNPRPVNKELPQGAYRRVTVASNVNLSCWFIGADSARGTVLFFHGYSGEKSMMLSRAGEIRKMGYNVFLADFMGSGESGGNATTIGYVEAQEVKACYDYVSGAGEKKIILFGTSMGAAAILKALHDYPLHPDGAILECPFGTLYKTTCARFRQMGVPIFPMAALLDFWGGVETGFNALTYKPQEYARSVNCPVLLLWGGRDANVSRSETDEIFANLGGEKQLVVFPEAGHENYLAKYAPEWRTAVSSFLAKH